MRIVLCNCPPDAAEGIARAVVSEGLAACVNLVAVRSIYPWEGAVQDDPETTLVLKTSEATAPALRDRLIALHPYDLPEVVALPVDVALSSADYVSWVRSTARNSGGP